MELCKLFDNTVNIPEDLRVQASIFISRNQFWLPTPFCWLYLYLSSWSAQMHFWICSEQVQFLQIILSFRTLHFFCAFYFYSFCGFFSLKITKNTVSIYKHKKQLLTITSKGCVTITCLKQADRRTMAMGKIIQEEKFLCIFFFLERIIRVDRHIRNYKAKAVLKEELRECFWRMDRTVILAKDILLSSHLNFSIPS